MRGSRSILNSILGRQILITRITIRNPLLGKDTDDDKLSILDILAIDDHGRSINIEIQTTLPAGMQQRLAYYVSSLYADQLTEGEEYTFLRPAICICVLTKPMFPHDARLHLDFRLRETSGLLLTDDLQVHLLQLSNLSVTAQNVSKASLIEQWAYFLLNAERMTPEEIRLLFPDPEFSEAAGVLDMISKNPEQRQQYEARMKFQRDEAARLQMARSEGIQQGRDEGLREGMEKGIEKGALLGRIAILKELLGVVEPAQGELSGYDDKRLSELAEQMQRQLRSRGV